MADVKWIKITTDLFDDEKILLIESLPAADSILVIWMKLLTLAGKQNNGGVFLMSGKFPYTEEMLATIFRRDRNTVKMALNTFVQLGMVEFVDSVITLPNWSKHQSLDAYERKKARDRINQANYRERQRLLAIQSPDKSTDASADTSPDPSSGVIALEEDKEKDKEIDQKQEGEEEQVAALYRSICRSFPPVRSLTPERKRVIAAGLNTYSLEDYRRVFELAEESAFLKGEGKSWRATFDWLIQGSNMVKVLEGNYQDRSDRKRGPPQPRALDGEEENALRWVMGN